MAAPIFPAPRPTFTCPVCGELADGLTFNAGWVVRGILGTRVGTYPDPIPNEPGVSGMSAPAEPFPALDEYVVSPCGDRLSREEAVKAQAALNGQPA